MGILELGAIGELIGGVAVVASLVYVGLQIRQNTRDTRASNFHAITDSFNAINLQMAGNPELARIFEMGNRDLGSLSAQERVQYGFMFLAPFRVHETIFYQSRSGAGEEELWLAEQKTMKALLSEPGARRWWKENPLSLTPEFREFVEKRILSTIDV